MPFVGLGVHILLAKIDKVSAKWNALAKQLNEPVMRRLRVARKA
ncbi:hypothetical protein [Roseateles noduli]